MLWKIFFLVYILPLTNSLPVKTITIEGAQTFDLEAGIPNGNHEFHYQRINATSTQIEGHHEHDDGTVGTIVIDPASGGGVVGRTYVTTTNSGAVVVWKIVKIGTAASHYPMTIEITKPGCSCTLEEDETCTRWTKHDIITNFEGLCYADKLRDAIKYVKAKIEKVFKYFIKFSACKRYIKTKLRVSKNISLKEKLFERYDTCLVNIDCTLSKLLEKLEKKLKHLEDELEDEDDSVGVFYRKRTVAIARVKGPETFGILWFSEKRTRFGKYVDIAGSLSHLSPGKHGFHIHTKGDIGNNCKNAAGHYNPFNNVHGRPSDKTRHVGDLGNIVASSEGIANVKVTDSVVSLDGPHSVIDRAVVIHAGEDDLGKGGNAGSLATGNAGARVGCAVIRLISK